jgi:hypothetical protein
MINLFEELDYISKTVMSAVVTLTSILANALQFAGILAPSQFISIITVPVATFTIADLILRLYGIEERLPRFMTLFVTFILAIPLTLLVGIHFVKEIGLINYLISFVLAIPFMFLYFYLIYFMVNYLVKIITERYPSDVASTLLSFSIIVLTLVLVFIIIPILNYIWQILIQKLGLKQTLLYLKTEIMT